MIRSVARSHSDGAAYFFVLITLARRGRDFM
jgi:hypothetical protein